MQNKTLDLEAIKARKSAGKGTSEQQRATFKADALTITVTRPNGEVVMQCVAEPRGFNAKEKSGVLEGGIGWYADVRGDDAGSYNGLPLQAGLRISVDGVKVHPSEVVDLTDDE